MSRRLAVVAFIALAIARSRPAGALVNPCQNAIGRAVVGYSKGRIKVISSCEEVFAVKPGRSRWIRC